MERIANIHKYTRASKVSGEIAWFELECRKDLQLPIAKNDAEHVP